MNFKERLALVENVLSGCSYETQKKEIENLFEKTNDTKVGTLIRLLVIDSCYSTNMNKRLFGFEELADLILKIQDQLHEKINVEEFVKTNLKLLNKKIGINKKGKKKGHAFSLITKYIYFKTKFNFPIYDRLVFDGLREEKLINRQQVPSLHFFERLIEIKNKYDVSFDELDKYFWVCGKIRGGSLSSFLSNSESYVNDFLKKLNLSDEEKTFAGERFNKMIAEKLVSGKAGKDWFDNEKLEKIQKLARSIRNERVFEDLKLK